MNTPANSEWSDPIIHRVDNEAEVQDIVRYGDLRHVVDTVDYIADDMFELRHPELMHDDAARAEFVADIKSQGPAFGTWVEYPWQSTLVRFPESDDHYDLRTYRNRNLITNEDQNKLHLTRIAAFGLSVGSNVVDRTVQSGIGNVYDLFDYDRLSPTNLNRIQAGMGQVGLLKTTIAGRKMAELDPYVQQHHYTTGYDRNTDDILRANRPDIIIEEVDNLEVKARLRRIAAELEIPLVMAGDVGENSMLDIERNDLDDLMPFNGKLSADEVSALLSGAELPPEVQLGALISMLGRENISDVLLQSVMLKGKELAGTPQLGTIAAIGGAVTSIAIRDILLGKEVSSGSAVFRTEDFIRSIRVL